VIEVVEAVVVVEAGVLLEVLAGVAYQSLEDEVEVVEVQQEVLKSLLFVYAFMKQNLEC
jgi:hypothetical protein